MGSTVLEIEIGNPSEPSVTEKIDLLVDSGAIYSVWNIWVTQPKIPLIAIIARSLCIHPASPARIYSRSNP
jgi:hypothetical protein